MATPGRPTLAPEIDQFRSQFEQLSAEADALTSPLSDQQFMWRPGPDHWSIAECLDHLNATARVYLPALDEGISDAIRRGVYGEGPFKYNWLGRLSVRFSHLRVRLKAPDDVQPGSGRTRREILNAFHAYQVQYIDRLRQANGVDLARARVRMPAGSWLLIPLGSAFELMVVHSRRHLAQARRISDAAHFPGN
jgi:DinB family protein